MAEYVDTSDYRGLCLRCPLSECADTDPRCLIQIAVGRENEDAGAPVKKLYMRRRRHEKKGVAVVDWGASSRAVADTNG